MTGQRKDTEQKVLEFTQQRTQEWLISAEHADVRGDRVFAIYCRNQAWRIKNGRDWLDDAD